MLRVPAAQGKLGLLGMQERATLAGGSVEIESSPGAGTTVFVRIAAGYRNPGSPANQAIMKKLRILLADDHKMVRDGLRLLIDGQRDMRVVGEAGNGKEALQQARDAQARRGGDGPLHAGAERVAGHRTAQGRNGLRSKSWR